VKGLCHRKRLVGWSCRVDATYVKGKGQWKFLYCVVGKVGNTVDSITLPF
jgi:putative transposase